jgi:hypothetical protein
VTATVPGFSPRTSGFHFPNRFAPGPVMHLGLGSVRVPVGNASRGLCGGMVFAARDFFEARREPPSDRQAPGRGTALFRLLVRRQFASFRLPFGPLRYVLWTWVIPRTDRFGIRGLAWRTCREQWPGIRTDLDSGTLVPLGLIRTRSLQPMALTRNHQVLAYGYELDGDRLRVRVYDPNHPDDDSLALELSVADPTRPTPIAYIEHEEPVYAFFRTGYRRGRLPGPG